MSLAYLAVGFFITYKKMSFLIFLKTRIEVVKIHFLNLFLLIPV